MITNIQGVSENRIAPIVAKKLNGGQALVITATKQRAEKIATDLSFFCDAKILTLPDFDTAAFKYDAKSRDNSFDYLNALISLSKGEHCIAVVPVLSAMRKLQPKDVFTKNVLCLCIGDVVERDEIIHSLTMMGYERRPLCEARGEFSVRGDIIDVFPCCEENPLRIELFDDVVDSIRYFDFMSQRSLDNAESADIYPARLVALDDDKPEIKKAIDEGTNAQYLENYIGSFYETPSFIWDYMKNADAIFMDDPSRCGEVFDFFVQEFEDDLKTKAEIESKAKSADGTPSDVINGFVANKSYPSEEDLLKINSFDSKFGTFYFTPFAQRIRFSETLNAIEHITTRQAPIFSGHMDVLETELRRFIHNGYKIVIACSTADRFVNLQDFISRIGLDGKVELRDGTLSCGTVFDDDKVLYLSENEIFKTGKKSKRRRKKGQEIKAFTDIKIGDFIVHEAHGVGQFCGVERLTADGSTRDYLKIQYAGTDVLYVPVDQMESIQKYVGSDTVIPKISKLSSGDWQVTKAKAKAAIKDMAADFIKASAQRQIAKGFEYGPDSAWQKEFEDAFPYTETDDQLRCTEEIKKDMQSDKAMDRLLCGDVGYGKTEVAARAIFKALEQGKQVAVLVPTTVLCSQHYHTFVNRFAGYPFAIDMLCRFRTAKEQEKTVKALEKGDVDLIIGTHRLLSSDVKFRDLGLLVVDEEQRFGVESKEAIKNLKTNVDVLTLSATPIPRTLHMSLTGIRDMSVIEEPPEDRYPVQTYVMEEDDRLICDAIRREVGRNGQVYFVYNRVRGIKTMARHLQEMMPEVRFAVGHGQMSESDLEDVMIDFTEHKYDVLVATTIIESGLDIPNVNTMIVMDSDRFGLSQLYQLRGRVGRSSRMAYAYLMYKRDKVLTEVAEKRLHAIREFTEFGSGFRIAMRDLELRGAGNILGVEQSGHMLAIGYELYCKLVEEAVAELKGVVPANGGINSDTGVELGVSAFLPERYVADELTRLDVYKRIASVSTDDERLEMYDELLDRFGEPPVEAENLLDVALIRNIASKLGILKIVKQQGKIVLIFEERNALTAEMFKNLMDSFGSMVTIYAGIAPRISYFFGSKPVLKSALEFLKAFR